MRDGRCGGLDGGGVCNGGRLLPSGPDTCEVLEPLHPPGPQYSQPSYHYHPGPQLMGPPTTNHQLPTHNHHLHYHHHNNPRSPSPLHLHHCSTRGSSSSSSSSINSSGRASATITTTTTNTNTPPLGFDSVGNSGLGASLLCVATSGHNDFALCGPPAQQVALMNHGGCSAWCSHHGAPPEGDGCLDSLRRAANRLADFLRGLFNS